MTALLMLAGCTAVKGEGSGFGRRIESLVKPSTRPERSAAIPDSGAAHVITEFPIKNVLFWDHVRAGGSSKIKNRYEVYPDRESFFRAFEGTAVDTQKYAERSFDNTVVIAVYITTRTGGWTFEPESVELRTGTLIIDIKAIEPEGFATQAFEDHVVIIAVDGSLYHEGMPVVINCPAMNAAGIGEEVS